MKKVQVCWLLRMVSSRRSTEWNYLVLDLGCQSCYRLVIKVHCSISKEPVFNFITVLNKNRSISQPKEEIGGLSGTIVDDHKQSIPLMMAEPLLHSICWGTLPRVTGEEGPCLLITEKQAATHKGPVPSYHQTRTNYSCSCSLLVHAWVKKIPVC